MIQGCSFLGSETPRRTHLSRRITLKSEDFKSAIVLTLKGETNMKRLSMRTVLKSKPFLASAACMLILLAISAVSPRGVLAGLPSQSFVLTSQVSEAFTGKTTVIDLGACPQNFCELRVGGSATLNPGGFGHFGVGTIGQFSVSLGVGGGPDTFYFPASTADGLRQTTTAPSSEDESRHEGYNYVLPPSGPFFTQRGEHIYLRFTSTSFSGGELQGTTNGTAIFTATTTKKTAGLHMPGTVGLVGAGLLALAGIFGVLTLRHIVAG